MPQPLSAYDADIDYKISAAVLQERPEHASLILQHIATIARAEHAQGLILGQLLGASAHMGLTMYSSLSSTVAQQATLLAVAKATLSPEDLTRLETANRKAKSSFGRRNLFAHGLWGVSEKLPNLLLSIPSDNFLDGLIRINAGTAIVIPQLFDRSRILAFSVTDLQFDLSRAAAAESIYFLLLAYINAQVMWKNQMPVPPPFDRITDELLDSTRTRLDGALQV